MIACANPEGMKRRIAPPEGQRCVAPGYAGSVCSPPLQTKESRREGVILTEGYPFQEIREEQVRCSTRNILH